MSGLDTLKRRIGLMISRVVINLINDAGAIQVAQVDGLPDETLEGIERFGQYGFANHPHPAAEGIFLSIGGARSHGVIIATEDRRFRLKVSAGEVALYDDLGQKVWLKRDGLRIESPLKVDIAAPEVTVTANQATLDADTTDITGNARIGGDLEVTGNLTVAGESELGAGATQFAKLANDQPATKVKAL